MCDNTPLSAAERKATWDYAEDFAKSVPELSDCFTRLRADHEALAAKPDPTPSEDVEEALADVDALYDMLKSRVCDPRKWVPLIARIRRALSQPSREALLVLASAVFDGVERFNFCSFCEHRTDDKCDTAQVRETCTSAVVAWAVGQAALTQATTPTSDNSLDTTKGESPVVEPMSTGPGPACANWASDCYTCYRDGVLCCSYSPRKCK